jgi:hypothetical protein
MSLCWKRWPYDADLRVRNRVPIVLSGLRRDKARDKLYGSALDD